MNSKSARLLRRYATANKFDLRTLKRVWNKLPWTKRHAHRLELQRLLSA